MNVLPVKKRGGWQQKNHRQETSSLNLMVLTPKSLTVVCVGRMSL